MAVSKLYSVIVMIMFIVTLQRGSYYISSAPSAYNRNDYNYELLMVGLNQQCPPSNPFTSPIEQMDGESLERALTSSPVDRITVVLFYASWCPFSYEIQSKFVVLASMFPNIAHVMAEESSVLPGVISRYGIRSLPSILMVNQTGLVQYYGPNDLPSLLQLYKSTAGLDPVVDMTNVQLSHYKETGHKILQPWNQQPLKEIFIKEPYLMLSLMFIILKAFTHVPHLSVRESNQLLRRVFHVADLKRIGNKVKTGSRSFNRGAQTARLWVSSLASV